MWALEAVCLALKQNIDQLLFKSLVSVRNARTYHARAPDFILEDGKRDLKMGGRIG